MPFKSLSSPRAQIDLQAEIRGGTFLSSPGLVAMLATDPVRLALIPVSGSSGKITNVSLDGAQDVALVNRDVALVRAADDAVWALLDLTHTAKVEQIARDTRSLVACPVGGSALALGWDGSATALTLGTNEVVARPFALRGTIRACSLTDTETFALVDGPDGGQLRVHPGPTPEPGASLRCNLPREVASFDKVRAGRRLAVVFKAGTRTVCVVTGGPNRLVAKLVQLDQAPTDIGVAETSMVVTTHEGSVLLFDGDAIAGASDSGALAAKYTAPLGLRGEPRCVVVCGKSEMMAWIGAASGEVVSMSFVKKMAG